MLVLSRKPNQSILLGGDIRVVVLGIRGNQIRLGIEAPERVAIIREELVIPAHDLVRDAGPAPGDPGTTS
ncbi:MAG TPA: carbon storage regulator [Isosphaeraceae bacterium]